jgi:hypothetical protein
MPSDSIAGFLDHAQASRVLVPEQIEQLIRQPDIPQSNLSSLCQYLLSRGVLTQFQADAIREGRGQELNFAGYPVVDELGPCPGGTAYKALHPSLRTPLVLRRLRGDWLAPNDNGASFVSRARAFGMLPHPNVVPLLDAGFHRDELYVVIDQPNGGADLDSLTREVGGAMPGFLAAEYARAIASALRMVHERGGVHGDVRPANLIVGPLTVKTNPDGTERRRPAPDATVRLAELGLVPMRPAATQVLPEAAALPYLPPERVDGSAYDPRGDIYGLGATLYFLLTSRPPFTGDDPAELLNRIRSVDPPPLPGLRPDLQPEFMGLVNRMMDKVPDRRPPTAYDIETALTKFCRAGTVPPSAGPAPIPMAAPASGVLVPVAVVVEAPAAEAADGWGIDPSTFATAHAAAAESAPRRREMTASDKTRTRLLFLLGGLLHLTAIGLVVAWAMGAFTKTPDPDPAPSQKKDDTRPKSKQKSRA